MHANDNVAPQLRMPTGKRIWLHTVLTQLHQWNLMK